MEISNLNLNIRDARKSDMDSVHKIFDEVLTHTTATFEEVPYSLQAWMEIFEFKRTHNTPFIVAESNNVVVGYGTFGPFRKASGYKITAEHSLHVDQQYRGMGIGKSILTELIARASIAGIENMIAAVDADNLLSVKLHEKFGFVVVGRIENVARKFARNLTLVLLQLRLTK